MSCDFGIFLNGSYGVGKSSVLDHIGDLLAEAGRPFSLMDVDWFHRSWPPRSDDPDDVVAEAENMAAVWANYLRAGPRQLVISGVICNERDRTRYESALRMPIRPVRLVASSLVAQSRLRRRYRSGRDRVLHWHLERHDALARRLDEAAIDEAVIDTDELAPGAVAAQVLSHFGNPIH